jgi:hypothetical protein
MGGRKGEGGSVAGMGVEARSRCPEGMEKKRGKDKSNGKSKCRFLRFAAE